MSTSSDNYFRTRLAPDERRASVWRYLNRYLQRYVASSESVLELGAGYCYFINGITAARKVAVDLDRDLHSRAAEGVEAVSADVFSFLDASPSDQFDVIFASNFLEHFDWPDLERMIGELVRLLRTNGRLLLIQPNFRIAAARYFDDYTHRAIFTDVSLSDWLTASGLRVDTVIPRFLPLTVKSRASALSFLIPLYLRSPIRPLAGQMFVVATKASSRLS